MLVRVSLSGLKRTHWYEYAVRFVLGGLATVFAGAVGARFGAACGGLFLALPAIFCASATLVESHERRGKEKAGLSGRRRGQEAAALDAAGAGLGAIALVAFAGTFFVMIPTTAIGSFAAALVAWTVVAVVGWLLRRKLRLSRQRPVVTPQESSAGRGDVFP